MLGRTPIVIVLIAFLFFAAACGSSENNASIDAGVEDTTSVSEPPETTETTESAESTETTVVADADFPATIESAGGTWTIESAPERIVSLSPTATEILFAIGAGDQVVAVDTYSYFPAEAPVTDLSGFDPNVESITALDPDLVIISNDANELVASLTALDIPVLVSSAPADIEGGYATMAEIGVATGHVDQTAAVISDLRVDIDAAFAAAPSAPIRIFHELGDAHYSASSFGFVGSVYAEMGAINIADEADGAEGGFPQLTEEFIVEADPELIVITDGVSYDAASVAARPGWEEVSAVRNGNIVVVNADIASRWGPRLPQFITAVSEALNSVAVGS